MIDNSQEGTSCTVSSLHAVQIMSKSDQQRSPSLSPPPTTAIPPSHRFVALRKVYTEAIRATLRTNTYENFSTCFPTPATYCPRALEGVWKQLNSRLEEECLKDFGRICSERDVENGLATWEKLIEDAKSRKVEKEVQNGDTSKHDRKPLHMLSAQELHSAHMAPGLLKAERDLQDKLNTVQQGNKEMASRIDMQRSEIQKLIEYIEGLVEDVEGAANAIETDEMRSDLNADLVGMDQDVRMKG